MPETRESVIQHYRNMRADLLAAIDGLDEAQLCEMTVDGWSVKDNLAHIALWDDLRADEIVRISAGHESALRMSPEHERDFGAVMYELRRHIPLSQAMWELERSHQRVLEAAAAATEAGLEPSSYGEAGLMGRHEAAHTRYIRDWRARMSY